MVASKQAVITRDSYAHWKYTLSIPGSKYRWYRKKPTTSLWTSQQITREIIFILAGLTGLGYTVTVRASNESN